MFVPIVLHIYMNFDTGPRAVGISPLGYQRLVRKKAVVIAFDYCGNKKIFVLFKAYILCIHYQAFYEYILRFPSVVTTRTLFTIKFISTLFSISNIIL